MRSLLARSNRWGPFEQSRSGTERLFTSVNPALYVSFYERAYEPAQL